MKDQFAALDVYFMVKELQQLVDSRVSKVYQPDGFLLQFFKQGKYFLRIERTMLWLTATKPENPKTISGLCRIFRKCLEGKKLLSLEQLDGERIIKMVFATRTETFHVYVELFSNGNVILTNEEDKIIAALEERAWKHRAIKKKETYTTPPATKNILALKREDFDFSIADTVSKHLAKMGFGKLYAYELCERAGVKPEAKRLGAEQRDVLFKAYKNILKGSGASVYPDGEIAPVKLAHKEGGKNFSSFSEAIDSKFVTNAPKQKAERINNAYLAKKEKIEKKIEMQEETVTKLKEDAAMNHRAGELIYEHYQELKEILEEINKAMKTRPLHEIKLKLKGHPKIKDINPKTKDVVVEISE